MRHRQDLDQNEDFPQSAMAVIEIPKGSSVRYKLHDKQNALVVSAFLPEGICYPENYGFLPRTLAEDGDALDIFVITNSPLLGLAVVEIIIVGGFPTESAKKGREEKLVGICRRDWRSDGSSAPDKLPEEKISSIGKFLQSYLSGDAEKKIIDHYGLKKAHQVMEQCAAAYYAKGKNLKG